MKMWIARDQDGMLRIFDVKPEKFVSQFNQGFVWVVPIRGYMNQMTIDKNLYPEVTFKNSPREVELKLK